MSLLEGLMLCTLVPAAFYVFLLPRGKWLWSKGVLVLPFILLSLHLLFEGLRWQLIPTYLLATILALISFVTSLKWFPRRVWRGVAFLVVAVALFVTAFSSWLAWSIPIYQLPVPTGEYAIGLTQLQFVDTSRPEPFTKNPSDVRNVDAWVWYPAQSTTLKARHAYWDQAQEIGRRLARSLELPFYFFDHLSRVKTHSFQDAPLSSKLDIYPVLLFSHGFGRGFFAQNTSQMEELASHGYIVLSIVHPYEALLLNRPNGESLPRSEERIRAFYTEMRPLITAFYEAPNAVDKQVALSALLQPNSIAEESVRLWAADTSFVLDELERLNNSDNHLFSGRLNLEKIGVWGHSLGGSVAVQVCVTDPRCKAGVNLDGVPYGDFLLGRVKQPFMFFYSDQSRGVADFLLEHFENSFYQVGVRGTVHNDFTDFTLLLKPSLKKAGNLGPIEGKRMVTIVNTYLVAFFDSYFKNLDSPLLKGPSSEFPEVDFRYYGL